MAELITSDGAFTENQRHVLQVIANMMIPASGALPAATDAQIFPGILERFAENTEATEQICDHILTAAVQQFDADFGTLGEIQSECVVNEFRDKQPELVRFIQICVASCYYKDSRVMASLGVRDGPPHPGGYPVDRTEWSLLEPVRVMGKIYRKV